MTRGQASRQQGSVGPGARAAFPELTKPAAPHPPTQELGHTFACEAFNATGSSTPSAQRPLLSEAPFGTPAYTGATPGSANHVAVMAVALRAGVASDGQKPQRPLTPHSFVTEVVPTVVRGEESFGGVFRALRMRCRWVRSGGFH